MQLKAHRGAQCEFRHAGPAVTMHPAADGLYGDVRRAMRMVYCRSERDALLKPQDVEILRVMKEDCHVVFSAAALAQDRYAQAPSHVSCLACRMLVKPLRMRAVMRGDLQKGTLSGGQRRVMRGHKEFGLPVPSAYKRRPRLLAVVESLG